MSLSRSKEGVLNRKQSGVGTLFHFSTRLKFFYCYAVQCKEALFIFTRILSLNSEFEFSAYIFRADFCSCMHLKTLQPEDGGQLTRTQPECFIDSVLRARTPSTASRLHACSCSRNIKNHSNLPHFTSHTDLFLSSLKSIVFDDLFLGMLSK